MERVNNPGAWKSLATFDLDGNLEFPNGAKLRVE